MTQHCHPDPAILLAEYTLGVLDPQDNAQVQTMLNEDRNAAMIILRWESELLKLVDALPETPPSDTTLRRIQHTLDLPKESILSATPAVAAKNQPDPGFTPPPVIEKKTPAAVDSDTTLSHRYETAPQRRLTRTAWVSATVAALLISGSLAAIFLPRTPVAPPVTVVEVAPTKGAILQAPGQSSTPGWVVTIDQAGNVRLAPQVYSDIPDDASVQLWTYSKALPRPRSLGLIDPNQAVAIPNATMGPIDDDLFFEMTQEPKGGSPTSEPSGPILFIGRVVTFGQ